MSADPSRPAAETGAICAEDMLIQYTDASVWLQGKISGLMWTYKYMHVPWYCTDTPWPAGQERQAAETDFKVLDASYGTAIVHGSHA